MHKNSQQLSKLGPPKKYAGSVITEKLNQAVLDYFNHLAKKNVTVFMHVWYQPRNSPLSGKTIKSTQQFWHTKGQV